MKKKRLDSNPGTPDMKQPPYHLCYLIDLYKYKEREKCTSVKEKKIIYLLHKIIIKTIYTKTYQKYDEFLLEFREFYHLLFHRTDMHF